MAPQITSKKASAGSESEMRRQLIDALDLDEDGRFGWPVEDGTMFYVHHPATRPKEIRKALKAWDKLPDDEQDVEDAIAIMLGDQYDAFVEHDGNSDLLQFKLAREAARTADFVNGRPIRS